MAQFRLVTKIAAPIERCFDLARDIDFHAESFAHTGERAVAGRTSELIELGETVTWEARHLGKLQRLTSKIVSMDRPRHFRDVMVEGAFQSLVHDHWFEATHGGTIMTDDFEFRSPGGPIGRLFDWCFLKGYLRRLLADRAEAIRVGAERTDWDGYAND